MVAQTSDSLMGLLLTGAGLGVGVGGGITEPERSIIGLLLTAGVRDGGGGSPGDFSNLADSTPFIIPPPPPALLCNKDGN